MFTPNRRVDTLATAIESENENENEKLKPLLADAMLNHAALKDIPAKKF